MTPDPRPSFAARLAPLATAAFPVLLVILGLGLAVAAAATYALWAGLLAGSVACFALQHFLAQPPTQPPGR